MEQHERHAGWVGVLVAAGLAGCAPWEMELGAIGLEGPEPLGAGTFEEVAGFGTNPGGLKMYRYVPPDPAQDAALVVALHGCTQSASAYRAAGWEELADQNGFYVVYAEQQSSNNPALCFNWAGDYGDLSRIGRGQDENQSIVEMVDAMQADFSIDPDRIFVTGHSAGAAMSQVMLATWPDLFAAGASIAGVPYMCPDDYGDVYSCTNPGVDRTADEWLERLRRGYPGFAGGYPRISVWHGTADYIVGVQNLTETVEQWTAASGIDAQPDLEEQLDGYPHREYRDAGGTALVEAWEITGAGHATFVDPTNGCGQAGAYFEDRGICSAYRIGSFFGIVGAAPTDGDGDGDGDGDVDADADSEPDDGDDCECDQGCTVAGAGAHGRASLPLCAIAVLLAAAVLGRRRPDRA